MPRSLLDVTRIWPSRDRSMVKVTLSEVASFSRTRSSFIDATFVTAKGGGAEIGAPANYSGFFLRIVRLGPVHTAGHLLIECGCREIETVTLVYGTSIVGNCGCPI
jgi:hypothetical protein